MSTASERPERTLAASGPPPARDARRRSRVRGRSAIGVATLWLSLIVLLPLAAVVAKSLDGGLGAFWDAVSQRQAVAALKFTLARLAGRDADQRRRGHADRLGARARRVPRQALVNALIDLPFALPTIVAGITLLALYGNDSPIGINVAFTKAAVAMALLFVTLPFVVRSVQPVLIELDREMEEAAASLGAGRWTTFRRIVLPNLVPAILAGCGARLRARRRRVRLDRADLREHPVRHAGLVGLRLQADRERHADRRRGGVGRAAAALAGDPDRDPRARALGGAP